MIQLLLSYYNIFIIYNREVLECPSCGVIYRSRERWYGNKNMEDIVSIEVRHVWPDVS
jgi:zinc finger FYVE domain-containing protein 1